MGYGVIMAIIFGVFFVGMIVTFTVWEWKNPHEWKVGEFGGPQEDEQQKLFE